MKQCKNCGHIIMDTALFCKECGIKVEQEAEQFEEKKKETIIEYQLKENQTLPSYPIVVEKGKLIVNKNKKEVACVLSIFNNADEDVIAVFLKICTLDISGEVIQNEVSYPIMDILLKSSTFLTVPEVILDEMTRNVKIEVEKVVFSNGIVWRESERKWLESY